jgi:hypothetical protein
MPARMSLEKRQALLAAVLGANQQMRTVRLLAVKIVVHGQRPPDDLAHAVRMNVVTKPFELFLDLNRHVQIEPDLRLLSSWAHFTSHD